MSDVVRVSGSSLKIQSSLDFYLRITSMKGIKSMGELRKSMYSRFMKEEKEKSKELYELEKSMYDSIMEDIPDIEVQEELESEVVEGSFGGNAFLQLVQSVESKRVESPKSVFEDTNLQFVEHGRFVEDYIEREYVSHGRFVEDYYENEVEDPCEGEEFYEDGYDEDDYYEEEPFIEEPIAEEPFEGVDLPVEEEDFFEYTEEEIVVQEPVKQEVSMVDDGQGAVDVPKDLREFLRQHPCSDISYVSQFFSRKEIDKQIQLGRVYKKRGKLMI